ncbi:MAG: PHP domain-containing protein [Candidatus Peribacteria bacterium]|nr:PHP domain-containing protein [Candidatus Peribacteria bacterium]
MAITDYYAMYGVPAFYLSAKDTAKESPDGKGLNAISGVELGFVLDIKSIHLGKTIGNICLIAYSDPGYYNLMVLTSFANQEGLQDKPKIDFNVLKQYSEGLIVFYGGIESWIGKMINAGETEDNILEIHQMLQELFPGNCYLEITAQDEHIFAELPKINQFLLHLSRKTDTPCIVNNNYFYPEKEDKKTWEMALAIKDNMKMYDVARRQPAGQYHIMTEEEIRKICEDNGYKDEQISERIANNEKIAEQAHVKLQLGQSLFPKYEAPDFIVEAYEKYKNVLVVQDEEEEEKSEV